MKRKYVIVGADINLYRAYEELPGALKSALDWKAFLDGQGFEQEAFLTGKEAERNNILPALTSLFSNLQKDDFAAFIYIGHGKQIKTEGKNYARSADENDELDETLICNGKSIKDDDIRTLLNLNKQKAPVFILIDACYNGVIEENFEALTQFPENNEIAFSSAGQLEEAYMEDYSHTKQAVYSTFLLKTLIENPNRNYNDVFDLAREKLKSEGYPQNPQLAFTNYEILKNIVFKSPVVPIIRFTQSEIEAIMKDRWKGLTGVELFKDDRLKAMSFLWGTELFNEIKNNNNHLKPTKMSRLNYPHNIEDVDNMAPFTLVYDEYDKFQVCHTKLGESMNFVVLIRILDSKYDPDGTITLNGFEIMVIHCHLKASEKWITLDTEDFINNPPVSLFYSEEDEDHHGPIVNFKVRIRKVDPIPEDEPIPVYYYSRPVKIRSSIREKLHFVIEGEDVEIQKGNSRGQMCLVDTPVGKQWVTYDEYLRITGGGNGTSK